MSRVVHFEIHATDSQAAADFYGRLFGWTFTKWDGPMEYWMIETGPAEQPGIDGGLVKRMGFVDGQSVIAYVCTVDVTSVDESVSRATELGGTIALPKMAIPGVGWLAYAKDPDGNIFGMMQADHAAA